jgi:hypothetical protein
LPDSVVQGGERGGDDLGRFDAEVATGETVGDDRVASRNGQFERGAFYRGLTELEAAFGFAGGDAGELGDESDAVAASVCVGE